MTALPTFYYPSTIAWVDDDNAFLTAASQIFENRRLKLFNDPIECLNFFNSYSPLLNTDLLRAAVEDERYELQNHSPVDLNVLTLHEIRSSLERLEEISVLIVDYQMPGIKGIDLCKQLSTQPAKKILLTGEANQDEAIDAFNSNVIDRFIRKDSPTLVEDIKKYVAQLSQQYFKERTKALLSHLEAEHKLPLSDRMFAQFFHELCAKNSINEYYLIDKKGSLMMVNDKNQLSYLIIHTDRSLNTFTELNGEIEEAKHFLSFIKNRQKIPHFGVGRECWEFEISEWAPYFHTPKVLEGRERYYYFHSSGNK